MYVGTFYLVEIDAVLMKSQIFDGQKLVKKPIHTWSTDLDDWRAAEVQNVFTFYLLQIDAEFLKLQISDGQKFVQKPIRLNKA